MGSPIRNKCVRVKCPLKMTIHRLIIIFPTYLQNFAEMQRGKHGNADWVHPPRNNFPYLSGGKYFIPRKKRAHTNHSIVFGQQIRNEIVNCELEFSIQSLHFPLHFPYGWVNLWLTFPYLPTLTSLYLSHSLSRFFSPFPYALPVLFTLQTSPWSGFKCSP